MYKIQKIILLIILLFNQQYKSQTLIKNIAPGLVDGNPRSFYKFDQNRIVFFAYDGLNYGLYCSDGTNPGTIKLTDVGLTTLNYSTDEFNYANQLGFTKIDSLGYVLKNVYSGLNELIRTNGSVSGTSTISFTVPTSVINQKSTRFFKMGNSICWIYPTASTPVMCKYNLSTNTISSSVLPFNTLYKILYVNKYYNSGLSRSRSLNYHLREVLTDGAKFYVYKYSGSPFIDSLFSVNINGAKQLVATCPSGLISQDDGVLLNDKFMFWGASTVYGNEPYVFNLSNNSISILKDVNPYFNYSSGPVFLPLPLNNEGYNHQLIYFTAQHEDYGREVWVTDGTTVGTKLVKDVVTGPLNGVYKLQNFLSYYHGDSLITSLNQDDTLRLITSNSITNFPSFAPKTLLNANSSLGYFYYSWRKGNDRFLLDQFGFIFKLGHSKFPIDTLGQLNCPYTYGTLKGFDSVMEINGCLFFNQADCSFTGYELYKYCNNSIYASVNELNNNFNKTIVYPNPTNSILFIKSNITFSRIRILNSFGQEVFSSNNIGDQISVSQFADGIYFIQLFDKFGKQLITDKFIKY